MQDRACERVVCPTALLVRRCLGLAIILLLPPDSRGEERGVAPAIQDQPAGLTSLERMRRCAQSLVVRTGMNEPREMVAIQDRPLLHFSDARVVLNEATIWSWGTTGRPAVLAAIFFDHLPSGGEKWSCEFVALSNQGVSVEGRPGWRWQPEKSAVELHPVPDTSPVGDDVKTRTRQMNKIARRFVASKSVRAERAEPMRLMSHPIQRYSDTENSILDGAIYAFANESDPEILLILECRSFSGKPAVWQYGFARLSADRVQIDLDEAVLWQRPSIVRWDSSESYFSVFGSRDSVFGQVDAKKREIKVQSN